MYIDEIAKIAAEDGKIIVIPGRIFDDLNAFQESPEKAAKLLYSALMLCDNAELPFALTGSDKQAVYLMADAINIYAKSEDGEMNGEEE